MYINYIYRYICVLIEHSVGLMHPFQSKCKRFWVLIKTKKNIPKSNMKCHIITNWTVVRPGEFMKDNVSDLSYTQQINHQHKSIDILYFLSCCVRFTSSFFCVLFFTFGMFVFMFIDLRIHQTNEWTNELVDNRTEEQMRSMRYTRWVNDHLS